MRRLQSLLPLVLVLTAACGTASGNRPADVEKPSITVRQASSIFFGSSNTAPVTIDVSVTNNAKVPLLVKEVEVRSPGMMQYGLVRTAKTFNETIPPGESRTLGMVVTAVANQARTRSDEPLAVQAIVRFQANGRGFREIVLENFAGSGT